MNRTSLQPVQNELVWPHAAEKPDRIGSRQGELSDADLVKAMTQRDEEALGILYDRWSKLVYSVAAQIVGPDDAEEILEDTFWQAWRQAEQYRNSRGKVSTWLTMIARSRALDRRKSRNRTPELPWVEAGGEQLERSGPCPLSEAIQSDERGLILAALGMLPLEQRETVELAYFAGLSQGQIAAELDQPLGTIKTRARLAAAKLRRHLGVLRDASK